ncbi:DUF3494 domain-containing protein [Hymenobacter sp. HMF4947]|uniref:DUF3494 domain-containing protein n=1 Tax=Hymenobacter ginkgonis TaxID=2682976 RepID=A0A7K1TK80_9BACT|nr:ice-binding family protein [Hymenobacter ginkgonis]MVN78817.1 DUF3494 domain-containing protein [Hymenobacter ginkgonis]
MKLRLLLSAAALLILPQVGFGQAPPPLGAAASFVLFTAVGAVNNSGPTLINGDIGTNAGAFTGFLPEMLTGQTQVQNSASVQAAADVRAAYSALSAVTCGITIGVNLGGQTLTPNTYCTGAAATLNGTLTLDGQGDPNSLFILNIDGALATGTAASVVLINGAAVSNVYWRITGRFDLGENALFRGTILSDGAINLMTGSRLIGRGLSQAGAISLATSTVSIQPAGPLPVELTAFSVAQQSRAALLRWTTASEKNSNYFEVQSSSDGHVFAPLGRVPGHGTSSVGYAYTWTDLDIAHYPAAIVYYRLRQVDTDGTATFSPVRALAVGSSAAPNALVLFPNPTHGRVQWTTSTDGPAELLDLSGRSICTVPVGILALDLTSIPAGVYILRCGRESTRLTIY